MLNFAAGNPITGYNLTRSLRFRASASAYLNRTPASAGNRQTWTWSAWVKRGTLGTRQVLFSCNAAGNDSQRFFIEFGNSNDDLSITAFSQVWRTTTQVFRDPSAWYHIVVNIDTTQATASNRIKLYINGAQVTAFAASNDPSLNANLGINQASAHSIGQSTASSFYLDGYMTEVNFIDGQALTPSSFGSYNSVSGVWQPARYTGTYGTNGFYLPFTDNSALTTSSNVGLGKDFSGNGNYWATNNISITAGVTYDSMTDVPTLTSATAANFAVLNPINLPSGVSVLEGNLKWSGGGVYSLTRATMAIPLTGKYYWEITPTTAPASGASSMYTGVTLTTSPNTNYLEQDSPSCGYIASTGNIVYTGGSAAYGTTYTTNDVIGVAVDMDNGAIYFAKNNTWQNSGVPTSGASKTGAARTNLAGASLQASIAVNTTYSVTAVANFGQRPFTYTPPTGFVALNTFNLPTSTIVKGNTVMDATTYSGDGTSPKTRTNAASFQPDLVWIKSRSGAYSHNIFDSVRGAGAARSLQSDNTNSEVTNATNTALYGYLSAFNSTGFSTTNGVGDIWVNQNGGTYVAWQWQAGQGTTSSNTSGTITSTVSVNASAGFSVATYTGTGVNATVGHGLGVAPKLIIVKARSQAFNWNVYSASLSNQQFLRLNTTDSVQASALIWNATTPTSSVFSLGAAVGVNGSGDTHVAYCWSEIDGFSKFGSYTGNGAADGPFVYTGFRPKWILVKDSSQATQWNLIDTSRDTYNVAVNRLLPNLSNAESTGINAFDILSNGFKIRNSDTGFNASADTYIYAAFAENPFKNALAR